jgi:hypothetical protein
MQTGMTVTYLLLGLLDPRFLIGAVVAVSYGAGLAAGTRTFSCGTCTARRVPATGRRSGPGRHERARMPGMPAAVVWIAGGCGTAVRSA